MLSTRALLVDLQLCKPGFERKDRRVTNKVLADAKARRNAGRFTKHLVPPEMPELAALVNYDKQMRETWFAYETSPFVGKLRLLDIRNFDRFFDAFSARWRPGRTAVVAAFRAAYQGSAADTDPPSGPIIEEAQRALADLYSPADYLPWRRFDFTCTLVPLPVPNSGHLAVELASEIASDGEVKLTALRQQLDTLGSRVSEEAKFDLAAKIAAPLARLVDRQKFSARADTALWSDLEEAVHLVTHCNVTRDPLLEQLGRDVEALHAGHQPDTLHADESSREAARAAAAAILERMKPLVAD